METYEGGPVDDSLESLYNKYAEKSPDAGGEGYRQPFLDRVIEGTKKGFGTDRLGLSPENQIKYDPTGIFQTFAAPADLVLRAPTAITGFLSSLLAGGYGKIPGVDETQTNSANRDLYNLGNAAMLELGNPRARAPTDISSIPRYGEVLPPVPSAPLTAIKRAEPPVIDMYGEPRPSYSPAFDLPASQSRPLSLEYTAPIVEPPAAPVRRAKEVPVAAPVPTYDRQLSPLGFYSHGAETAANLAQAKGSPDQMTAMLRKYGVKPDEFYSAGIADETATNVMRSKIEREYAPKLAAAKLEMDALGLNENTIDKKSQDYNKALDIRKSPETKAKYQYDSTLNAMRSDMDSAMVLRPEWASRPSVTRDELTQYFNERRPQVEETVLGGKEPFDADRLSQLEQEYASLKQHPVDDPSFGESKYNELIRLMNIRDQSSAQSLYAAGDRAMAQSQRAQAKGDKAAADRYFKEYEFLNTRAEKLDLQGEGLKNPTKFQQYTLPGGENYREILLTASDPQGSRAAIGRKYNSQIDELTKNHQDLNAEVQRLYADNAPGRDFIRARDSASDAYFELRTLTEQRDKELGLLQYEKPFRDPHWDDPNVIAHLRFSDRVGPNGEKILHMEEAQSGWGQKGRKEGFAQELDPKILDQLGEEQTSAMFQMEDARKAFNDSFENIFKDNLKNALKDAPTQFDIPNALKIYDDIIKSKHPQKRFDEYKSIFLQQANTFTPEQEALLLDSYNKHFKAEDAYNAAKDKKSEYTSLSNGLPTAPYVTNTAAWTDLALKRALKEAAEGGYDKLVWTPGAEQAKRYDLSKHVSEVRYDPNEKTLFAYNDNGTEVMDKSGVEPNKIADYIGKEAAEKLLLEVDNRSAVWDQYEIARDPKTNKWAIYLANTDVPAVRLPEWEGNGVVTFKSESEARNHLRSMVDEEITSNLPSISGQDLVMGGEGMKAYYDKIIPNQLGKQVKKLDPSVKVGITDVMLPQGEHGMIGHNNPPFAAPGVDITPKMREAIMKGQTDFARGGSVKGYAEGGPANNSLEALYNKYAAPTMRQRTRARFANGGPVSSAAIYDPAEIDALAASIIEGNYA